MLSHIMEEQVFQQVANVAFLPGIVDHSLAMPDIHWGYGFPIGGVAATRVRDGVVSPGGVGFDINCGVRLLRTKLTEEEMQHANTLQDIRKSLTVEQLQSPCDKELSDIVARTQRMLRGVLTESIKNLDDAYELAHELEFSELNAIFKLLATKFFPPEQRRQIVPNIMQHQQKLLDFSHNFGDRDWRKGISIHAV